MTAAPVRSLRVGTSGTCETVTLADEPVEITGYAPPANSRCSSTTSPCCRCSPPTPPPWRSCLPQGCAHRDQPGDPRRPTRITTVKAAAKAQRDAHSAETTGQHCRPRHQTVPATHPAPCAANGAGGKISYTPTGIVVILDRPITPRLGHALRLLLDEINTTRPRITGAPRSPTDSPNHD